MLIPTFTWYWTFLCASLQAWRDEWNSPCPQGVGGETAVQTLIGMLCVKCCDRHAGKELLESRRKTLYSCAESTCNWFPCPSPSLSFLPHIHIGSCHSLCLKAVVGSPVAVGPSSNSKARHAKTFTVWPSQLLQSYLTPWPRLWPPNCSHTEL